MYKPASRIKHPYISRKPIEVSDNSASSSAGQLVIQLNCQLNRYEKQLSNEIKPDENF